jgi:hypothetical protein
MSNSLRSLTYSSEATAPFSEQEFAVLGLEAARLNALDGITGMLVFNGLRFCQTVEGSQEALADLLERLRGDPRHRNLVVTEDCSIRERRFRSWDMQLLSVPAHREEAMALARQRFDDYADLAARKKLYHTVEGAFA